jgi:hypothetical protein
MSPKALNLKTDEAVLEALRAALPVSADQLRAQRISFVFGTMKIDGPVTREQVKRAIDKQDAPAKK